MTKEVSKHVVLDQRSPSNRPNRPPTHPLRAEAEPRRDLLYPALVGALVAPPQKGLEARLEGRVELGALLLDGQELNQQRGGLVRELLLRRRKLLLLLEGGRHLSAGG
jgi:hypothetical protein